MKVLTNQSPDCELTGSTGLNHLRERERERERERKRERERESERKHTL